MDITNLTTPPIFTSSFTRAGNATVHQSDPGPAGLVLLTIFDTAFYSFIIASGVVGNGFVVSTLARWREMRTPFNFLICNISIADLCVCVIAAPLRIIEMYLDWPFGRIPCFVVPPLQDVFVCVSVVTQTVLALERHRAIVAPCKPKLSRAKVKLVIPLTWLACYIAVAVPHIVFLKYETSPDTQTGLCYLEFPPEEIYRISYAMCLVVFFIITPLVIQATAYVRIIKFLQAKEEIQENDRSFTDHALQRRNSQRKRLVKMLVISMVVFQVCYLPRGVLMLMDEFAALTITDSLPFWYANVALLALYYVKHIVNPVILWSMSKDFRGAFKAICICGKAYPAEQENGNSKNKGWKLKRIRKCRPNDVGTLTGERRCSRGRWSRGQRLHVVWTKSSERCTPEKGKAEKDGLRRRHDTQREKKQRAAWSRRQRLHISTIQTEREKAEGGMESEAKTSHLNDTNGERKSRGRHGVGGKDFTSQRYKRREKSREVESGVYILTFYELHRQSRNAIGQDFWNAFKTICIWCKGHDQIPSKKKQQDGKQVIKGSHPQRWTPSISKEGW